MFYDKPKKVYAIFPYDENGKTAGVYVGMTEKPVERIKLHLHDTTSKNGAKELHDLMRSNGYHWVTLSTVSQYEDRSAEYDWIDYFQKKTDLKVFNERSGCLKADWHKLGGELQ